MGWQVGVDVQLQCAVKYGENEVEGWLMGIKSGTIIRIVALTNVDVHAGPAQSRAGHSNFVIN